MRFKPPRFKTTQRARPDAAADAAVIKAAPGARLEQQCRQLGVSMNVQRRLILAAIEELEGRPSAEDIYKRARSKSRALTMGVVDRTLQRLTDAGILTQTESGDGAMRYEDSTRGVHTRLIDVGTGRTVDFQDEKLGDAIRRAAEKLGYSMLSYRLNVSAAPIEAKAVKAWSQTRGRDDLAQFSPRPSRRKRYPI